MQEYVKHLLDGCYLFFVGYLQEKKTSLYVLKKCREWWAKVLAEKVSATR